MAAKRSTGPDLTRCFGSYRQQSVTYALEHCLACPKMKACVRVTWGWDQPQIKRSRRGAWDQGERRKREAAAVRAARPELMAT